MGGSTASQPPTGVKPSPELRLNDVFLRNCAYRSGFLDRREDHTILPHFSGHLTVD